MMDRCYLQHNPKQVYLEASPILLDGTYSQLNLLRIVALMLVLLRATPLYQIIPVLLLNTVHEASLGHLLIQYETSCFANSHYFAWHCPDNVYFVCVTHEHKGVKKKPPNICKYLEYILCCYYRSLQWCVLMLILFSNRKGSRGCAWFCVEMNGGSLK